MSPDTTARQVAYIERCLRVFHPLPGTAVELRSLRVAGKRAVCEVYADLHGLAVRAAELDAAGAAGCYCTLNPLRTEIAGWKDSRVKAADVLARHWLPVDCDSDKARPRHSNATDAEKAAGRAVLGRARGLLDSAGLVGAVVGDSGNGWHLCYPVELPNDPASQDLVKAVLAGLHERCSDRLTDLEMAAVKDGQMLVVPKAQVTAGVHDAPRVWKLYGTRARKGPHAADRPHRWSVLAEGPAWEQAAARANAAALRGLLERWRFSEDMREGKPQGEGASPAERARAYVAKMAPAVSGQGGHNAAFLVAEVLARGFALPRSESWPILCEYNARCVPPWSEKELLHKIETAERDSRLPVGYLLDASRPPAGPPAPPLDPPPPARQPVLIQLSTVTPEAVRWLWPGWMPEGALVILDGDPGLGKSMLTMDLTARVTTGRVMPPGDGEDLRGPAGVLLLGAEDSLKHTVRPRLDAAGADCSRVYSLEAVRAQGSERPPGLPRDLHLVAEKVIALGIKLVIVDPLMAFLGGEYDSHKDQDIRRALRPMAKLAEDLEVTILLLRHLNKLCGGPALYRGTSSIGITGAARAALIVGRDPDCDRHVLAMNKLNLARMPASLAYRIEAAGISSKIVWDGEVEWGPNDILGHAGTSAKKAGPGRPDDALQSALQFLEDLLAGGPVAAADVLAAAEEAEHSWRTVERAKKELGVQARKQGKVWFWHLRSKTAAKIGSLDDAADLNGEEETVF